MLEDTNVELANALSGVFGVSGQLMLEPCWKASEARRRSQPWHNDAPRTSY